jgi:hypothetical protein
MSNVTETPITHTQAADEILLTLRRLIQAMRGYTPLTTEGRRRITLYGHVDDEFLRQIAVMLDANANLAAGVRLTGPEVRDHLSFYGAHEGVGDELILLGQGVKDTLNNERGEIGQKALQAFAFAKTLTKPADRERLMPHLENLQKNFSRGKRRKTTRPVDETPTPTTPAPATPEPTKPEMPKPEPPNPQGVRS